MTTTPMTPPSSPTSPAAPDRLLRNVLRENAVFSATSGMALAAGSTLLDDWLGVRWPVLVVIGVGLVAYSAILWRGAASDTELVATGRSAVAGDAAWVIAAAAIIAATNWLTRNGEISLAVVSAVVAAFALGQAIGLSRMSDSDEAN